MPHRSTPTTGDPDTAPTPTSTPDRLTAAFARVADARYAIGILETCGMDPVQISLETVDDGRGGVSLVILRVAIDGVARDRVLAAISGGHGVPVPEPQAASAAPAPAGDPTPIPMVRVA